MNKIKISKQLITFLKYHINWYGFLKVMSVISAIMLLPKILQTSDLSWFLIIPFILFTALVLLSNSYAEYLIKHPKPKPPKLTPIQQLRLDRLQKLKKLKKTK